VGKDGVEATSSDGMTWSETTAGTTILYGISYGNGIFAAVGGGGTILISSDGTDWTNNSIAMTACTHYKVANNGSMWVLIGSFWYYSHFS
jgi:hypothetical protein